MLLGGSQDCWGRMVPGSFNLMRWRDPSASFSFSFSPSNIRYSFVLLVFLGALEMAELLAQLSPFLCLPVVLNKMSGLIFHFIFSTTTTGHPLVVLLSCVFLLASCERALSTFSPFPLIHSALHFLALLPLPYQQRGVL